MSIAHLLNTTADMKRPTPDYDGMGNVTYALSTFSAAHPCRVSSSVPTEVTTGPTQYAEANAMIYVTSETSFNRDDQVHHGSDVYEVLGVLKPSVPDSYTALVCKVTQHGA